MPKKRSFEREIRGILHNLGVTETLASPSALPSEAAKLLQPSPDEAFSPQLRQLERQLSEPSPRVVRQLYVRPPAPRLPEDTKLSTLGFVAMSFYANQSHGASQVQHPMGILHRMLETLRPVLAMLGFDGPRWKDFEALFLSSSPEESVMTYRLIMDSVSRLRRPAVPVGEQHSTRPREP